MAKGLLCLPCTPSLKYFRFHKLTKRCSGGASGIYNGIYYQNWMEHTRLFMRVGVNGKWIPVDEVYYIGESDGSTAFVIMPSPAQFFDWIDQHLQLWQVTTSTIQTNCMLFTFCLRSCSWLCHLVETFDVCFRTYSSLIDSKFYFEPPSAPSSKCFESYVESLGDRLLSAQACRMY